MTFFKFLAMYTVVSIAAGLAIAAAMRWCLHYEPPQMPPLPSGSIDREVHQ
jgi:hypothetical protein